MKLNYIITLLLLITQVACAQTKVTFEVDKVPDDTTQKVGIRGNLKPLSWDSTMELDYVDSVYTTTIDFPDLEDQLEFKFVRYNADDSPTWETIDNRKLKLVTGKNYTSKNSWNQEQLIDVSSLEKIPSSKLLEDYKLIELMVLDVHPGTYRYNNKKEIESALKELKNKFSKSLTYGEAYLAISKMTALLKCDHTKAGYNNQNVIINNVIHYQKDKLPFAFKWIGDKMIVTRNASGEKALDQHPSILKINDVDVKSIMKNMKTYIGADGSTDANRIYKMGLSAYDFRYHAFDIFYPLLYPMDGDSVKLEIRQYEGDTTETIYVAPLTREERSEILTTRYVDYPITRDDLWDFEMLDDHTAILTIGSFGLNGWKAMTLDYKEFLANCFEELQDRKIDNLIIDLRENTGGADEMADELFSYLSEYNYDYDREGRTRYLKFPEALKPYIRTWGDSPWYYNLNPKSREPVDGYYIFKDNFKTKKRKSYKNIYKGKSYLLTSSANTSLAYYTAYRFKYQKLGPIIGQETGGNLNDINGGQIIFMTLPNSTIEIDFPVMGGFITEPQPDKGVIPDVEVIYAWKDIIDNSDIEVEEVLKLIDRR